MLLYSYTSIAGQLGEMYKATQGFWAALVSLMWTWVGLFWPFLRDIAYPVVFVVTRVGSFVSWRLESTPKRMFLGLDQNEDLSLDHSEFIAGAEQFADALEQPAIRDPERIEKAFQFMTHGGGDHDLISLKSFLHWWNSFELRDLFVRLDRDGSEGLDRTEVHTGLLTLQQHFGVLIDDREKMFTAMDPNGAHSASRRFVSLCPVSLAESDAPVQAMARVHSKTSSTRSATTSAAGGSRTLKRRWSCSQAATPVGAVSMCCTKR